MCKYTTAKLVKRLKDQYGNKYDYSKVVFKNWTTPICLIDSKQQEIWKTPAALTKAYSTEQFIQKARAIHGSKYDYSKVEYQTTRKKVCIICPKHGEFWQTPNSHLVGKGCKKCANQHKTTEQFIAEARKVHGDKYDYSKTIYEHHRKPITVICPIHGEFHPLPCNHLIGHICPKCASIEIGNKLRSTTEEFIEKARKIHGDKYDYSCTNYIHSMQKVDICCPKHGIFSVKPNDHLNGCGCASCQNSTLENHIATFLTENNIRFEPFKKWKFLKRQNVDFYLPDYHVAIECQGKQHFCPIEYFGGERGYKAQIERDKRKFDLCTQNGIKIFYYCELKNIEFPYKVYTDKDILLKDIKTLLS